MMVAAALAVACGGACVQETSVEPDAEQLQALATTEAMATGEPIGEAEEPSAVGDACAAACVLSYATYCTRVMGLCGVAETVTIGGATVPCSTAIAVACLGGTAVSAICSRRCPP
jgi:hypothetical protein